MSLEFRGFYRDEKSLYDECKRCISYHIIVVMSNGSALDGIIEDVDNEGVTMLVAEDVIEDDHEDNMNRQQSFGYKQPRRFRRFRRRRFPISNIDRVNLLRYPYFIPPYPIYPYYPYYPY